VEASVGDTLQFRFELQTVSGSKIAPELNADSMLQGGVPSWAFVQPVVIGHQVVYNYPVQSEQVQWIHLVYNDDVILRYKLNVRKPKL
jgi:hypothetical protein